jgi:hypothetical protein
LVKKYHKNLNAMIAYCHSRAGGNPENIVFPGLPLPAFAGIGFAGVTGCRQGAQQLSIVSYIWDTTLAGDPYFLTTDKGRLTTYFERIHSINLELSDPMLNIFIN